MGRNVRKIVAIASSTGGPRALQTVISGLPGDIGVPVLIVQHMPVGFTEALAKRLDSISELNVVEATNGQLLLPGTAYLCRGGIHMNIDYREGRHFVRYGDEPPREGVKPCANYMYESLANSQFDEIVCAVMTGMGADGTEGIGRLARAKRVYVIAQNAESCAVFGMPKAAIKAGIVDKELTLALIANEITKKVRQ